MSESAEKMFWQTRELVDKLVPFLDVESVSRLAEAHHLTAQVLQDTSRTWKKLVERSCPYYEHVEDFSYWARNYHDCVTERASKEENISHLTRILKEMENPKVPLVELLHVICNRFPPVLFKPALENGRPMAFHLRCPCKSSHSVNHLGFLLLEKVEGALKSAEQEVETAFLQELIEPWLSSLDARVSRQQSSVNKVEAARFVCRKDEDMEKLISLQQKCKKLTIGEVIVFDCRDGKGDRRIRDRDFWAKRAIALQLGDLEFDTVRATRHDLQGGSRENLRAIWDALGANADGWSSFHVTEVLFDNSFASIHLAWDSEERKDQMWIDFQLMLATPPEQWPEYLKEELTFE